MTTRRDTLKALASMALAAPAGRTHASGWPERTVSIVIPSAQGGATDTFSRAIAQKLTTKYQKTFVVENKPGATGLIGTAAVAHAKPDGYTILVTSNSFHIIAPLMKTKPAFDPVADFDPITIIGRYPFAVDVNPGVPARNIEELIALAKRKPGDLKFGTIGPGSGTHLVAEMFMRKTGVEMRHIPYRGTVQLGSALVAGEIDVQFDSVGAARPLVDAGRVRILAVTGNERSFLFPDIPSLGELGIRDVDATIWIGCLVPKGTPVEIASQLERTIVDLLRNDEDTIRTVKKLGADVVATGGAAFGEELLRERESVAKLLTALDIPKD